jgi:hypothetical protein
MASRISDMKKDRFTQDTILLSETQEQIVCVSNCVVVGFDYNTLKKTNLVKEYHLCYDKYKSFDANILIR